jgi:hypothetical protein
MHPPNESDLPTDLDDPDATPEQHARRIAGLDARERKYQSLHFITLALFVLFGVLILIQIHDHVD